MSRTSTGALVASFRVMLQDLARGSGAALGPYMQRVGVEVGAANLCASLSGQTIDGVVLEEAVERLLDTRGEALNGFVEPKALPSPAVPSRSPC